MNNFAHLREDSPFYDLFEHGMAPIKNIILPNHAELEGSPETEVYMLDLEKCGNDRLNEICRRLAAKAGIGAQEVFGDVMMRGGLPIRKSQTTGVSTDVPFWL